jgi:hypothetical protein
MSTTLPQNNLQTVNDLSVILPEPTIVKVPLPGGKIEELHIMPLPFLKWRKAFRLIAILAPELGFDLTKLQEAAAETNPDKPLFDKTKILTVLQSDKADYLYEFVALAIDKPVEYFNNIYETAIDITAAVVVVNINFFGQRLLPKS